MQTNRTKEDRVDHTGALLNKHRLKCSDANQKGTQTQV